MTDFDEARRIALTLPQTIAEGSGFAVNQKGYAWTLREKVAGQPGRVERPEVLAIRVANNDEKDILIASDPAKFYTIPHYNGFPAVLVRLPAIDTDELAELLTEAWRLRAPRRLVKEFDAAAKSPSKDEAKQGAVAADDLVAKADAIHAGQ